MTLSEGLGYSRPPCETLLSVAGFFTVLGAFLPGEEVYSQGEKRETSAQTPSLFDVPNRSVVNPGIWTGSMVGTGVCTRGRRKGYTYQGEREGIYTRVGREGI